MKTNFIFFLFFLKFCLILNNNEYCETVTEVNNENDCFNSNYDQDNEYCCFYKKVNLTNPNTTSTNENTNLKCKIIPKSSYYTGYNYEIINNELYKVTCPKNKTKQTYALEQCGAKKNGKYSKDICKSYSSFVDSCCYYNKKNNLDSDPKIAPYPKLDEGCYWLGAKYEGSIFWAGARLECDSIFINNKNNKSIISFILLLIFILC